MIGGECGDCGAMSPTGSFNNPRCGSCESIHTKPGRGVSYNEMLAEQSGKCAICRTWDGRRLYVDHDHKSGRVRGLLCNRCNSMLGVLEADPKWLDAARNYLDKHAEPACDRVAS